MTEAEWLCCTDPMPMLEFLRGGGKPSERKLRLFACACCRDLWGLLADECFRNAVEVAERFADGKARKKELNEAKKASGAAFASSSGREGRSVAAHRAFGCAWSAARTPALSAAMYPTWVLTEGADRKRQGTWLRDLIGNPFRTPPLDPAWLAWNDGAAVKLARAAYEERSLPSGELDRARLAVLADALEDAGCSVADILGHLRGPGPHVRGCWAVDLLLGGE
jgi:hypothetical protein